MNASDIQKLRDALGAFNERSLSIVLEGVPRDEYGITAMELASGEFDRLHTAYLHAHCTETEQLDGVQRMEYFSQEVLPFIKEALKQDSIFQSEQQEFVESMQAMYRTMIDSETIAEKMAEKGFSIPGVDCHTTLRTTRTIRSAFCHSVEQALEAFGD
jgi:hypothetical protein